MGLETGTHCPQKCMEIALRNTPKDLVKGHHLKPFNKLMDKLLSNLQQKPALSR